MSRFLDILTAVTLLTAFALAVYGFIQIGAF